MWSPAIPNPSQPFQTRPQPFPSHSKPVPAIPDPSPAIPQPFQTRPRHAISLQAVSHKGIQSSPDGAAEQVGFDSILDQNLPGGASLVQEQEG